MKGIIYSIGIAVILIVCSCSEDSFLDPKPSDGTYTDDFVWSNPTFAKGVLYNAFQGLPASYSEFSGNFLAVATDDAVVSDISLPEISYATGFLSPSNNLFGTWETNYSMIKSINLFLERGLDVMYIEDSVLNVRMKDLLKGQAFFLRAWYHWDLLKNYAGVVNAEVLGVPIVTSVLDVDSARVMTRNTFSEVVDQIVMDCDTAQKYLPLEFTGTDKITGAQHYGSPTQYACEVLKAKAFLYQASPAYNLSNDAILWQKAAVQAISTLYEIESTLNAEALPARNFFDPENYDIIWRSSYANNYGRENSNFPPSFYGRGYTNPSQNLVDAFFMTNGYPISDERSGYSEDFPYLGREDRFESYIIHNGSVFKDTVVETYKGGRDSREKYLTGTRTSYYLRKHISESVELYPSQRNSQPNFKVLLSLTDLYFTFAEVMNEFAGPTDSRFGFSAEMALSKIRKRAGFDPDPYMEEVVSQGKVAFRELLKQERRVEMCFEGERYYDIRRWGDAIDGVDVYGMEIIPGDLPGVYNIEKIRVETRKFKSPYGPLPFNQVLLMPGLEQNDDWK